MSSKTTILWLLVAVALGAAALFLLRSSPSVSAGLNVGDPVMRFDSAKLATVRIEHPDGAKEVVNRNTVMGGWQMKVWLAGAASAAQPPAWPVPSSRIEALTRLLLDTKVRAVAPKDATLGDRPTVAMLAVGDGGTLTVRMADRSVAGTALIEVEEIGTEGGSDGKGTSRKVRAMVDDRLHELFRGGAPREWRDRTVMPFASADTSRVRLTNSKGDIVALGRVQGVWSLREPVAAPADPASVQRVLSLLGGLKIADFLDGGAAPDPSRFNPPNATVVLEADRREVGAGPDAAATTKTEQQTLEIGGPSDSGGTRLFSRLDKERTIVIDARSVADLRLDAALYVWPYPTRVDPSEIGTIVLRRTLEGPAGEGGTAFRRELDKWKQMTSAGETLVAGNDLTVLNALITLLTGVKGDKAGGAAPASPEAEIAIVTPRGYEACGEVRMLSLSGATLETIEVGRTIAGKIVLKTGAVYRTYAVDRVPTVLVSIIATPEQVGPPKEPGVTNK